jgi:hypothetical protein
MLDPSDLKTPTKARPGSGKVSKERRGTTIRDPRT